MARAFFRGPRWIFAIPIGVVAAAMGLVFWLRHDSPIPVQFVPLAVTHYRDPALPARPMARRDLDGLRASLPVEEDADHNLDISGLRQKMRGFRTASKDQPLIVYASAFSLRDGTGNVYLLPTDAQLDQPTTWLPLREVLEHLKESPAKQKLLILDLSDPLASPRRGVFHHDALAGLQAELARVADPERLVLTTCGMGQSNPSVADQGQSLFGQVLAAGLGGQADGCLAQQSRDGTVSVLELVHFTRARVERWSQKLKGQRQTPLIFGAAGDYAIVRSSSPSTKGDADPAKAYPEWLLAGWKERDARWNEGIWRDSPESLVALQMTLGECEQAWRMGADVATLKVRLDEHLTDARGRFEGMRKQDRPRWWTLELSKRRSLPEVQTLALALRDWIKQAEVLAATSRPDDQAKVRQQAIDDFRGRHASQSDNIETAALSLILADRLRDPSTLLLLDQLLQPTTQSRSRSVEAQTLHLAAATLREHPSLSPALLDRLFDMTAKAELALHQPAAFAWTRPLLEEGLQYRQAGEIRVWAHGYGSAEEAARRLELAEKRFEAALAIAAKIEQAKRHYDEALVVLPSFLAHFDSLPIESQKAWEESVLAAIELAECLREGPPPVNHPDANLQALELHDRVRKVHDADLALAGHWRGLMKGYQSDSIARLVKFSQQGTPSASTRQMLESLLAVSGPVLTGVDRAKVWQASQDLTARLRDDLRRREQPAEAITPQSAVDRVETELAVQQEQIRGMQRARAVLQVLQLSLAAEQRWQGFQEALSLATRQPSPDHWNRVGQEYLRTLRDSLTRAGGSLPERIALGSILPALTPQALAEEWRDAPTELSRQQQRQHWQFLATWHHSQARALELLNLESPMLVSARLFYFQATQSNSALAGPSPTSAASFELEPINTRSPNEWAVTLRVVRHLIEEELGAGQVSIEQPEHRPFVLEPATATLSARTELGGPVKTPLTITAKTRSAGDSGAAAPGFLVEAKLGSWPFHRVVTLPRQSSSQELKLLVSADPHKAEPALELIYTRPGNVRSPLFVHVRGESNVTHRLIGEVWSGSDLLATSEPVMLIGQDTVRLHWKSTAEAAAITDMQGPLELKLRDADTAGKIVARRHLPVVMLAPREITSLADCLLDSTNKKLTVRVRMLRDVSGAVPVELHIPGQGAGVEGTFRGELTGTKDSTLTLFADNLSLPDGESGFSLSVDGIARTFQFRVPPLRPGEARIPLGDGRAMVRLIAPDAATPASICVIPVEVDNAPPGARLEVVLGRNSATGFDADITRTFESAQQRRIGWSIQSGVLSLQGSVNDWHAVFDTSKVVGQRWLRARLLDDQGRELVQAERPILFDGNAPRLIRFLDPPTQAQKGRPITLTAQGADSESGIAQVAFFVGRPEGGKMPADAAPITGVAIDDNKQTWSAEVPLPATLKGPTPVTVRFVNRVGLATFETTTIDLTEIDPALLGPGRLIGQVLEASRPQPNLEVTLRDDQGKIIARTRTQTDGTFQFDNLPAGRYQVFSNKPESGRRGQSTILVEPRKMTHVQVVLSL